MLKVFALLTKLDALDRAGFGAHWRHPHGTLTKRMPQVRRYVQNLVEPGITPTGLAPASWSGVAAIWQIGRAHV